jgi:hypothetical protein
MQINQPMGLKPKAREQKLRSIVNWQGALNKKGVKRTCVKQGLDT